MLEQVQAKLRRIRTRLVMRSALGDGFLYRRMRGNIRDRFNGRAEQWDQMVGEHEHKWFSPLDAAMDTMPDEWTPAQIVDIGGGTGRAAYHLAERYPGTEIVVIDIAPKMLGVGKGRASRENLPRVEFVAGDSTALPLRDDVAELAYILNAPPNVAELRRILRPGGVVVFAFTYGHHTPMYLDEATSRRVLERAGFQDIRTGRGGEGTFVIARLPEG